MLKHMKSPHNEETMAKGGAVKGEHPEPIAEESDNEADPDTEMSDMIGGEMMDHIHNKNKKGLMDSLHAAIAMHKSKDVKDDGPDEEED